jgi:GAF domain-containing protein
MSATHDNTSADPDQRIADLERQLAEREAELAECKAERDEALAQQTASTEVLQVINASAGRLAPVFDAMLDKAMQLCRANFGAIATFDGDRMTIVALRGIPEAYSDHVMRNPIPDASGTIPGRIMRGESIVHIHDLMAEANYRNGHPDRRALVELGGARTSLSVALRKDDTLLGMLSFYRQDVRPFSEREIALLQNFAAQAVIAMENARLLTETREALEQQTATAEVLGVINSSPGDLTPVFDAMLDKATRLCDAAFGILWRFDDRSIWPEALHQVPAAFAEFYSEPKQPPPDSGPGRMMRGENAQAFSDIAELPLYAAGEPMTRAIVDLAGAHSSMIAPLRKDGATLGAITIYRQEVRPFTDKQIALLQNFAAQAVIAMENARLLTETRQALEQQTATAEILGVINSSPGNLVPVFDAMLDKALRLCVSPFGALAIYDGEFIRTVAHRGLAQGFADLIRNPVRPSHPGMPPNKLLRGAELVHISDIRDDEPYRSGNPNRRALADQCGARTAIWVPLRRDGTLLGFINVYRQEVRPFSDKQIVLLQNFAAQAVIAMENARLLTETREALEQQTATAEVLQVINSSPGDLAPVFEAILKKAHTLCGVSLGSLASYDGTLFHRLAMHGYPPEYEALIFACPTNRQLTARDC